MKISVDECALLLSKTGYPSERVINQTHSNDQKQIFAISTIHKLAPKNDGTAK